MQTWVRFSGLKDPLEEDMVTQFRILAWKISWTEESGELQSMGSQRVRHDLVSEQQQQPILNPLSGQMS